MNLPYTAGTPSDYEKQKLIFEDSTASSPLANLARTPSLACSCLFKTFRYLRWP